MKQALTLISALAACGSDGYDHPGDHEPGELAPVIGATYFDDRDCLSECARCDDVPGGFKQDAADAITQLETRSQP